MARIQLRQWNIGGTDVYHTYVAFVRDNGALLAELHGDPYHRDTGIYSDPISAVFEGTQTIVADWDSSGDTIRISL